MYQDLEVNLLNTIKGHAVLTLNTEGVIEFCNDEGVKILGYETKDIIEENVSLLWNADDNEKGITERYLKIAANSRVLDGEAWIVKNGGGIFWGKISLSKISNDEEQLTGFTLVITDINDKKYLEQTSLSIDSRFQVLVNEVKDYAIFMLNPQGIIQTWNKGAQLIKGYAPEEIIGKHFSIFYIDEDLKSRKPERELNEAITTGKYEEEGWRIKKDGSVFWANVVITALRSDDGQLIGFSKVTRDLTERRKAEDELKAKEEQSRLLVNSVKDYGIFMLDPEGIIMNWNEGAKKINGYSKEEIVGKHFSIFYTEEDLKNQKPQTELVIAKELGKYEEEGWRIKKDKTKFWANVIITPIFTADYRLMGYAKVTRDLTEKRIAEQALKASQEQYRKANIDLLQTVNELEQFTSVASHDLQEPLRTISSYLQLVEKKLENALDPDVRNYIERAVDSSKRMKALVINLLQYSRISREDAIYTEVNVHDIIAEALNNLKKSIQEAGAEIKIENNITSIMGDKIQLVQLFQNLIGNAVKFTKERKPEILIKGDRINEHVKFEIIDNGIGIKQEYLNKIFEIFKRLHDRHEFPGTGIGLAICKRIVEHHKGTIWAESKEGEGTKFIFTLKN